MRPKLYMNWKFELNAERSMFNGMIENRIRNTQWILVWAIYRWKACCYVNLWCRLLMSRCLSITMSKQSITEGTNNYHITTMSPVSNQSQRNGKMAWSLRKWRIDSFYSYFMNGFFFLLLLLLILQMKCENVQMEKLLFRLKMINGNGLYKVVGFLINWFLYWYSQCTIYAIWLLLLCFDLLEWDCLV